MHQTLLIIITSLNSRLIEGRLVHTCIYVISPRILSSYNLLISSRITVTKYNTYAINMLKIIKELKCGIVRLDG